MKMKPYKLFVLRVVTWRYNYYKQFKLLLTWNSMIALKKTDLGVRNGNKSCHTNQPTDLRRETHAEHI